MSNIHSKVPVQVQKKSGFDKSYQNLYTGKVGTIMPILTDEVIPNTTVNLRVAMTTQLPPLATDTYMRLEQKYAAFFVPKRILWKGAEEFITGDTGNNETYRICTPGLKLYKAYYTIGGLADMLGCKMTSDALSDVGSSDYVLLNAEPFLAYHQIWNDWFRNPLVQKDIFQKDDVNNSNYGVSRVHQMFSNKSHRYINSALSTSQSSFGSQVYADGSLMTDLRQANFGTDLFTCAQPSPQNGQAQGVTMTVKAGSDEDTATFTISALRAANSMQQFLERNNIAGTRLTDYVRAQYGANLSDSIAQRPVLLGSGKFVAYSKGIYQTSENANTTANPFNSVATKYGTVSCEGQDLLIENFTAQEPGYIMVLSWLSPKPTYSSGVDPMLTRYHDVQSQSDMANPILQNVGNEPIFTRQLDDGKIFGASDDLNSTVFGYSDRYYAWKDKVDEVHGIVRDGSSLEAFALQRSLNGENSISSAFLQIPINFLDQVSAVSGQISTYGYWTDCYFDYKVSMPLAKYSVPSLQDPAAEHGETIMVNKGGTSLS